ncbi:MAG TPA: methionyl-tRNA formyltransferase [Candidatus Binatia bacterium]
MSQPWRIVFMGTPRSAAVTLERLLQGPDPVVGVVTRPDRPAGRGQKTIASPVSAVSLAYNKPVLAPQRVKDAAFLSALTAWAPDVIVVVAFGRILPRAVLDLPAHGCINVHYSLLPKYRGAAPMTWALANGETKTGVTTMKLVEEMDAGPVLLREEVAIGPGETAATLEEKLTPLGARLLLETLKRLKEGTVRETPQRDNEATFAPMLKKEDGRIDWTRPATVIERLVRAFSPWPSAYTHWQGRLLKVHRAEITTAGEPAAPGEVVRADSTGLWVGTGAGVLNLVEVQMENKKRLPGPEFVRGARIQKGAWF